MDRMLTRYLVCIAAVWLGCGGNVVNTDSSADASSDAVQSDTPTGFDLPIDIVLSDTASDSAGDAVVQTESGTDVVAVDVPQDAGRVPMNHRADNSQCLTAPGPGTCAANGIPGQMCAMDSQCTAGTNGRCENFGGGPAGCFCSYDTCTQDSTCTMGGPCARHGSAYLNGGNTCTAGNCHVDSDCGTGGYCSPSQSSSQGCGGLAGYYCHTPNDTCTDDSDCGANFTMACMYNTTLGRWQCGQRLLCG